MEVVCKCVNGTPDAFHDSRLQQLRVALEPLADRTRQRITEFDALETEEALYALKRNIRRLPKLLRSCPAYVELRETIDDLCEILEMVNSLLTRSFLPRHWARVLEIVGRDIAFEEVSMQDLKQHDFLSFRDDIYDVVESSMKEERIKCRIVEIQGRWFSSDWSSIRNLFEDDPIELLNCFKDDFSLLHSLIDCRFSGIFQFTLQAIEEQMKLLDMMLKLWTRIKNRRHRLALTLTSASSDITNALELGASIVALTHWDQVWSDTQVVVNSADSLEAVLCSEEVSASLRDIDDGFFNLEASLLRRRVSHLEDAELRLLLDYDTIVLVPKNLTLIYYHATDFLVSVDGNSLREAHAAGMLLGRRWSALKSIVVSLAWDCDKCFEELMSGLSVVELPFVQNLCIRTKHTGENAIVAGRLCGSFISRCIDLVRLNMSEARLLLKDIDSIGALASGLESKDMLTVLELQLDASNMCAKPDSCVSTVGQLLRCFPNVQVLILSAFPQQNSLSLWLRNLLQGLGNTSLENLTKVDFGSDAYFSDVDAKALGSFFASCCSLVPDVVAGHIEGGQEAIRAAFEETPSTVVTIASATQNGCLNLSKMDGSDIMQFTVEDCEPPLSALRRSIAKSLRVSPTKVHLLLPCGDVLLDSNDEADWLQRVLCSGGSG